MSLESAPLPDVIAKSVKKKRKAQVRKPKTLFTSIFITGTRFVNFSSVKLSGIVKKNSNEIWENDTGFVITGTSRPIEAKILSVCKNLKIRVLQYPANFGMYTGASAEQVRNLDVIETFKPKLVIILCKKKSECEDDSTISSIINVTKRKNVQLKVIEG